MRHELNSFSLATVKEENRCLALKSVILKDIQAQIIYSTKCGETYLYVIDNEKNLKSERTYSRIAT